jgi:DNA sulfur modification protein DndD
MRLTKLKLRNVGPYNGETTFQFRTESVDKPITLIGGKNGAGKTTILESILIALYGQGWKDRQTQKEYKDSLRNLLHESSKGQADEASIELELQHGHLGELTLYRVVRTWGRTKSDRIEEELQVYEEGQPIGDVEKEYWREFLRELVPRGVSELFFFDAERIRQLADGGELDQREVRRALDALLGLDLVDRLQSDLQKIVSREARSTSPDDIKEEIKQTEDELAELQKELKEAEIELQEKNERLEDRIEEKQEVEQEISEEGGSYAERREKYKEKKRQLEAKYDTVAEQIRDACRGLLPALFAGSYLPQFEATLDEQAQDLQREMAAELLKERAGDLASKIQSEEDNEASEEVLHSAIKDFSAELQAESSGQQVHPVGLEENNRLRAWLSEVRERIYPRVKDKVDHLNEINNQLREVEEKLSRAPDKDQLQPLIETSQEINEEIGRIKGEIDQLEEDTEVLENKITRKEQSLDKRFEEAKEIANESEALELAQEVRKAFGDYYDRLTEKKIEELNANLTDCFTRLTRKGEYYESVELTPDLEAKIETSAGGSRDSRQVSAGESQLIATSLLWALAETSGRRLPFVIDTPLGRLDKDHRENLAENFFPNASHQVILLSTDTEVDEGLYKEIEDHVSRAYLLNHQEAEGVTNVEGGYFW